jgi:SAM-dependent methyltransferase
MISETIDAVKVTEPGAAIYTPLLLKAYDWWVLEISNRWAWECSTQDILLPFFRKHLKRVHLDVGPGTGFYLANSNLGEQHALTLLDLNENSLNAASERLKAVSPAIGDLDSLQQDILKPLRLPEGRKFDSISLFYLLHCLPGELSHKEKAITNLKSHLTASGVLYGATILGDSAEHNSFGKLLMTLYNRKGIFSNRADNLAALERMFKRHFSTVTVRQHGKVALFSAHNNTPFQIDP